MRAKALALLALLLAAGTASAADVGVPDPGADNWGCGPGSDGALRCLRVAFYCMYVLVADADGIAKCLLAVE